MAQNKFSQNSMAILSTCHPALQQLFFSVLAKRDCSIISGSRGEEEQNKLFDMNLSECRYPDSKHNFLPSLGVDVIPYPVDWDDKDDFRAFAEIVKETAKELKIKVRWGGDYKSTFDGPHWYI